MTELFQMPRGMLKDLLLLHYYELRSAEEKKAFLTNLAAWAKSDPEYTSHLEVAKAVNEFKNTLVLSGDETFSNFSEKNIRPDINSRNEIEARIRQTYGSSVYRNREYEQTGRQTGNITAEAVVRYLVYNNALKNSPWLYRGSRKDEIDRFGESVKMFDQHIVPMKARSYLLNSSDGSFMQLLSAEDAEIAGSYMEESEAFAGWLTSDKKIRSKEPFLEAFTDMYRMDLKKGLSEGDDATQHHTDPCYGMLTTLFYLIKSVPSEEELKQLKQDAPGTYDAAQKIRQLFDAYAKLQAEQEAQHELLPEEFAGARAEELKRRLDERLGALEEAVRGFAGVPHKDVKAFYEQIGADKTMVDVQLEIMYDDAKTSPASVIKELQERRAQLAAGILPEEGFFLKEFAGTCRNVMKGLGRAENAELIITPYRELLQQIGTLAEEGAEKRTTGFASTEEKSEFFRKSGEKIRTFMEKTDELFQNGVGPKQQGVSDKAWKVTLDAIESVRQYGTYKQGAFYRAARYEEQQLAAEKVKGAAFRKEFDRFYEMMADTKGGYLFHSNSREYEKMMQTLRTVKELSGKEPLNDHEMRALGESGKNIEKVCTAYLDREKKMKSQNSGTGKDRFAGAMGILNLVDHDKAEALIQKAGEKRGKRITWEELKERADASEKKRPKKPERTVANELAPGAAEHNRNVQRRV